MHVSLLLLLVAPLIAAQELAKSADLLEPPLLPEAFILSHISNDASAVCIDSQLAQCKHSFNYFLNITADADWTDPATLIHLIGGFFDKGVDGVLSVCKARTMFQQCLGSTYTACLLPTKFIRSGVSLQAAWQYIGIMRELEFICNGGLLQTMQNWQCIRGLDKQNDNAYQVCKQAYLNTTQSDPTTTCDASIVFANCARAPYFIGCGADSSWFECERVRVSLNIDKQCPDYSCPFKNFLNFAPNKALKYMPKSEQLAKMQHVRDGALLLRSQRNTALNPTSTGKKLPTSLKIKKKHAGAVVTYMNLPNPAKLKKEG